MKNSWYPISNIENYDTPFIAVYPDRVRFNIELALSIVNNDPSRLRPHIKTHKSGEIIRLFLDYGISKVKCATVAEAELAAANGIKDVLLAYQPAGFKIKRLFSLAAIFPETRFSCLIDNMESAEALAVAALSVNTTIGIYVDINTGMDRTGFPYQDRLKKFYEAVGRIDGLEVKGIHIYDGHIHDIELDLRCQHVAAAMDVVRQELEEELRKGMKIIAGGSNTFSCYARYGDVECSPGTFVFWDVNYTRNFPELEFKTAAVLVARVISKPGKDLLCLDAGYKSVASENPLDKRLVFPWNDGLMPVSHSEEHLTVRNNGNAAYKIGDVLYAQPFHICPTIAMYEEVKAVENNMVKSSWKIKARDKTITV